MLKQLDVKSGLGKQLFYNQPFLNGTSCNSSTFLKEISYNVNLTDLYQVVGSCYYNAQMEFCPVIVQIKHHILRKEYGCNYLLQVWNKDGQKVFQRGLQSQLNLWSISNEYFIYKPMDGDDDADCFHITNLKKENSTLLVTDTILDPTCKNMVYNDGVLYISNQSKIFLIECRDRMGKGEKIRMLGEQIKIQVIKPGLPIHAIFNFKKAINMYFSKFLVIVAMETQDNQLDFSALEINNVGRDTFTYQFKQQREVVNREVRIDKISKFVFVLDAKNTLYGIAMRDSGKFDLYWDMILVDSNDIATVFDVSISFDTLYFWLPNGQIKYLSNRGQSQINYQQAEDVQKGFQFDIIFYQNIKNNFNLYNSFTLIRTTLYVVHGAYVSLFSIQDQVWMRHIRFEEGEIIRLIKKWSKGDGKNQEEKLDLAILLKTGSIYNNILSLIDSQNNIESVSINNRTFQVPGRVLKSVYDTQDYKWFYVMVKDYDDRVRVFVLHYDQLYELNEGLENPFDEFTTIVPLFDPDQECHILTQKHSHIVLYEQKLGRPEMKDDQDMDNLLQNMQDTVILRKVYDHSLPITGIIHSCISLNIHDHLFLIDETNFYKISVLTKKSKIYKDQNCVGLYVIDKKYCYTLSHSSEARSSGIRLYDVNNILNKKSDISYKLQDVQVGFSGLIDWNQEYSRLSFLESFDRLNIVPALHRNTIAFIGMAHRKDYLATKVIKDKFIALDQKNQLFCWSGVTGKLLHVNRLPNNQDYSNYQIYQNPKDPSDDTEYKREWYQKILLMKKQPETFFDQSSMDLVDGNSSTKNQQTFAQQQKRELREFKLIEIVNEDTVREHFNFIHPLYPNENQRIFFDENTNYMLEKLTYPRIFLYEKILTEGRSNIQWRLMRRFNKFPEDLESESGPLKVLSPCFSYFVDIDRGNKQFVIRDTFTQQEVYKVSKDLMDPAKTPPNILMNRFKWVDCDTIIILNDEGVEKKIDIKDNFKEIEFNIIPLYDNNEVSEPSRNYYNNRPELSISEVLARLKRKYQRYKTAYYLEHRREPFSLYSELFTVDYQIDKCSGMHVADMSFTFLHWRIIEQLDQKKLMMDEIDDSQIEVLCYNILPGGDTILHELCSNGVFIKKIFEIAHPNDENISETKFHIPFIQNLDHMSPMHLAMQASDIRIMDTFLKYLAGYGLDHHSRALTEMIPFMIEKQLPSLLPYLDSRLQQTNQVREIKKGCLKKNSIGVSEQSAWFKQEEFTNKLMATSKNETETLIERPIKVEFIDIPRIYHYSDKLSDEFFMCLAETDQYEIFEKKVIQKVIEFNYPIAKYWTIKKLLIPFMMFQATLFIYLNLVFQQEHYLLKQLDFPLQLALGIFSWYFLQNELSQMREDGLAWFSSVWNYIDVITPCTISYVILVNTFQLPIEPNTERTIQAIGVFFMWLKFLQFFRIFKSYGYLIRLIVVVISDMSTFMVVLFITIVAFSDTFLTLSNGNEEHDKFVFSFTDSIIYVYRIILGDFDVSQFGKVAVPLCYTLFLLCTIFNTIVMLNLLIAIISESFSYVKENASNAAYQEMAGMIAENNYVIPQHIKETYAELNRYIVVVTDLEAEIEKEEEESVKRIDQLKKHVLHKIEHLSKDMKDLKDGQNKQHDYLDKSDKQNNKILMLLQMMQGHTGNASVHGAENANTFFSQSIAMNFRSSMKKTLVDKDFDSSRRYETESQR